MNEERDKIEAALRVMERSGGNFIKKLADCYRAADHFNKLLLRESFGHYFRKYREIAESNPERFMN